MTIRVLTLVIAFLALFGAGNSGAEEYKIGAVNTIRILEQSPQVQAADALIKKEFSSRDRELVAQQKELKTLEERLNKEAAVLSEANRKSLERELINARREFNRSQEEFREDINFRSNEERAKIQNEVFEAIVKVAKENSYDLVLFDGVAFASGKVDISDLIIDYLKKRQEETEEQPALVEEEEE